jgi:hypothetical protein
MIFIRETNFLGSKFLKDQISWGSKKSGAQMTLGTISDIATFRAKNIGKLYFSSYHVCGIWWTERHPFLFIYKPSRDQHSAFQNRLFVKSFWTSWPPRSWPWPTSYYYCWQNWELLKNFGCRLSYNFWFQSKQGYRLSAHLAPSLAGTEYECCSAVQHS